MVQSENVCGTAGGSIEARVELVVGYEAEMRAAHRNEATAANVCVVEEIGQHVFYSTSVIGGRGSHNHTYMSYVLINSWIVVGEGRAGEATLVLAMVAFVLCVWESSKSQLSPEKIKQNQRFVDMPRESIETLKIVWLITPHAMSTWPWSASL